MQLTLADVQQSWQVKNPRFIQQFHTLVTQDDPEPESPIPEDAFTFDKYLQYLQSHEFARLTDEEQVAYRQEKLALFDDDKPENYLSDRLRSHVILMELWQSDEPLAREFLLELIATLPLFYGPWKAIKAIFKEAESRDDSEIVGALVARFDVEYANWQHDQNYDNRFVRKRTLGYLARRGWRYLRERGVNQGYTYADCAVDVLAHYPEDTSWSKTWVANHIFYHETGDYSAANFTFRSRPSSLLKYRAFADMWRRSPRPLFNLLERAQSEQVRRYAVSALKQDFRTALREVEPAWVSRLAQIGSSYVDDFITWIIDNVPKFEQAALRDLGLHDTVLRLFFSESDNASKYACDYARVHARDISNEQLIRIAKHHEYESASAPVVKFVKDVLGDRDPRKAVGLDVWQQLLPLDNLDDYVSAVLLKHFTAKDLTPGWFADLLKRGDTEFAEDNLLRVHKREKLGADYFIELALDEYVCDVDFPMETLGQFDLDNVDIAKLQTLLLSEDCFDSVIEWISEDKLTANRFDLDFLKALAYEPDWDAHQGIQTHRKEYSESAVQRYNSHLGAQIRDFLADVRRFKPEDLGFEWLMQLVARPEADYHDFAESVMTKAYLPGDFAPQDAAGSDDDAAADGEINIDLQGAKILFTGKLATMTRSQAQDKLRAANGAVASAVNNALDYLVIGDEGSPLYGEGRKGSKQVKAEALIEKGADLRVISETAFLKMLAGETREVDSDTTIAGCQTLWDMATAEESADTPQGRFALHYLRLHHPDICLKETDRFVDPGAEIPAEFLTFEQVEPLFHDARQSLREYALEVASYEFANWNVPIDGLVKMAAAKALEVRQFVQTALLADDAEEHKRYRIDTAVLTVDAVYRFCESADEATRQLGMQLIGREARLQLPEELFRLTESPDRHLRAFVIRNLWKLYRARGSSEDWQPREIDIPNVGKRGQQAAEQRNAERGEGNIAIPSQPPAVTDMLQDLLKRMLFELPPGRSAPTDDDDGQVKLKPLAARKAKLALIESMRDIAIRAQQQGDTSFSEAVLPVLTEFMGSKGQAERQACLVAVTRIQHAA